LRIVEYASADDVQVVIASRKSSTFEGYQNFPWSRTHTQMNKFEGPKDIQYKDVSGNLKEMSQKAFKLMKTRQDCQCQFEDFGTVHQLTNHSWPPRISQ